MTQGFGNPPPPWGQPPAQGAPPQGQPAAQPAPAQGAPPWQPPQGAPLTQQWGQPPGPSAQPPQGFPPPQPAPTPQTYGAPQGWTPPQAAPFPPQAPPYGQPPHGYGAPQGYPSPVPGGGFAPQPYGQPPQGYPGAAQGYPPPGGGYAPQAALGSPLGGVGEASTFTKSPYFPHGVECIVQLDELKGVVSQDPARFGALMIVVECVIVQSNTQGIVPGNRFAQVINMQKYGKGDLKAVLTALHGGIPGNAEHEAHIAAQGAYSEQKIREFISPAQPLRGRKMALRTIFKPNKNPLLAQQGKGFTNHFWTAAQ